MRCPRCYKEDAFIEIATCGCDLFFCGLDLDGEGSFSLKIEFDNNKYYIDWNTTFNTANISVADCVRSPYSETIIAKLKCLDIPYNITIEKFKRLLLLI
jgi:hypothetical protein